jgi:hypothetical protein
MLNAAARLMVFWMAALAISYLLMLASASVLPLGEFWIQAINHPPLFAGYVGVYSLISLFLFMSSIPILLESGSGSLVRAVSVSIIFLISFLVYVGLAELPQRSEATAILFSGMLSSFLSSLITDKLLRKRSGGVTQPSQAARRSAGR